jgi:GTP cyclohydrolase I
VNWTENTTQTGVLGHEAYTKTAYAGVISSDPQSSVRNLLRMMDDPDREGLRDTPARVVRSLREMTRGYAEDPAAILTSRFSAKTYDEMVVVRGVPFWSLCEHHLLPFHGAATVGYIPNGRVVGLSKLARLVECFARRLQMQERLTEEIAAALQQHLKPRGVGVIVRARHLCMEMRGVRAAGDTITSKLTGAFKRDARARAEFLHLGNGG